MTQPRHRAKRSRKAMPNPTGLSPEVWKTITSALPGTIRAVATLIEAIRAH